MLITGGSGYLGGRLTKFLVSQGCYEILVASRQETEAPSWLLPLAKVIQIRWDVPADIEEVCSGVDVVVHLAGMNAQDCMNDPTEALNVNAIATSRLLHSAVRQSVKRFIYLSSAHVYGSPLTGTITEDTCPVNLHPYATSHRAGEDVVRGAHRRGEVEGIVIRLSNAYGVPMHNEVNCWMLIVNELCRQAVTEQRLVLHTTGLQRRDFITLDDAVRGIEHLIGYPISKFSDCLFNLGGNHPLRVIDLVRDIAERCYVTLGFKPTIQIPEESVPCNITQPLDYRIDKLLATGFLLKGEGNNEIDATLKFCHAHFKENE